MGALLVLALLALGPVPGVVGQGVALSTPITEAVTTLTTQLSISPTTVIGHAGANFWGVNMAPTQLLGPTQTQQLAPTGISYIRWPSAKLNDQYDITTNLIHNDNGTTTLGRTTPSEFVSWCQSVHCHAILGIPGEINSPTQAAQEVLYVEQVLGFHPAYWEIGNEPGLWTHYDVPWSHWNTGQSFGINASGYAQLVQRYIGAIHGVDPTAPVIGLPGTGIGAYGENEWIFDTVQLNGPNLSAVAIHVYPAGHLTGLTGNLSDFDQSLLSKGSLDSRVPLDKAAIVSACPTCRIQLFATEFNAASVGAINDTGTYGQFMQGFYEVPYVAAEVAQGLLQNVRDMDFYNLEGGFPGALFDHNESARPVYYLFTMMLRHLEPNAVQTTFSGSLGEFYGVASVSGSTSMTLLVANANPSTTIKFGLGGSGFYLEEPGTAWTFTSGMTEPSATTWSGSAPLHWTVPAESVLVINVT